ncbi:acVLRF1 family peptidyl-tRNA hydrolase [Pseudarthrobacter sulfonivorans]|uniref:acVLRF1 family peptidyl-tRNA hydrolase n=1 Tax=Pseudarthrobacter sulfonivorans TaxID=121292 RepID=UPI002106DE04|nr:acVLRF1 family peptidyl-tRNA hydrolase [Pseudarthrobacter sulfonivorans]
MTARSADGVSRQGSARAGSVRTAFVPGSRLAGWVERFGAAHGGFRLSEDDDGVRLAAADGAFALLQPPWPPDGRPGRGGDPLERLASVAAQPRTAALVLVRRGGYGIAVASEGVLLAGKTGSTYVQSRSAAGGQSQQRFARRRANQAAGLVEKVAVRAAAVLGGHVVEYVAPGGDRTLAGLVLEHPAMKAYAGRSRLAFLDVADPSAAVLKKAAADVCSVRIQVTDAG